MQRARRAEDKEARAREILEAGLVLLRRHGFGGFTMAELAAHVGLAKGTLFLYFPTREALCLAAVHRLLGEWFDDVDDRLGKMRGKVTSSRMARNLVDATVARTDLVALLSILGTLLEHNIDVPTARAFKTWLLSRMALTGALVEKVLPEFQSGDGIRMLLHLHALLIGLYQHAAPASVVVEVLRDPELSPLRVDLARELDFGARALINAFRERTSTLDDKE